MKWTSENNKSPPFFPLSLVSGPNNVKLLESKNLIFFCSYLLHVRKIARHKVRKNKAPIPKIKAIQWRSMELEFSGKWPEVDLMIEGWKRERIKTKLKMTYYTTQNNHYYGTFRKVIRIMVFISRIEMNGKLFAIFK